MNNFIVNSYRCEFNKVIEPYKYYAQISEELYCIFFRDSKRKIIFHLKNKKVLTIYSNSFQVVKPLKEYLKKNINERKGFNKKIRQIFDEYSLGLIFEIEQNKDDKRYLKNLYKPTFIVGCGRSGTSLLLSILSSNKQLFCIPNETYTFYPGGIKYHLLVDELKRNKRQSLRIVEKTPKHIHALEKINNFYNGKVKFIHIVRDPRAVIVSKHPNHKKKYWVSDKRWLNDVSKGLEYEGKNLLLIKYEDLINKFDLTLRKICKFISVKFDKKMQNFHKISEIKKNVAFENFQIASLQSDRNFAYNESVHQKRISKIYSNKALMKLAKKLNYNI